jgi:hypothetical protein
VHKARSEKGRRMSDAPTGRRWGGLMPRAISKSDINFGLIKVGVGEVLVWIDYEGRQLFVGDREFELSQLATEQLDRLEAMASAVTIVGEVTPAVRRDLTILVAELIRKHTH